MSENTQQITRRRPRRFHWQWLVVVAPALLSAGCARKPQQTNKAASESTRADSMAHVSPLEERTATKMETISLEGMEQTLRFRLFDSRPAGITAPFTTYVPDDMAIRSAPRETGDRFVARAVFGGQVEPRAFVEARFLPEHASQQAAAESLAAWAPDERPSPLAGGKRFDWSVRERWIRRGEGDTAVEGIAALGRHGARWFVIQVEYPIDYGEGLLPRVERVLEEWRWEDTGGGLGS
jgi:hypothetical protein